MFETVFRLVIRGFKDMLANPWAQALTYGAVTMITFLAGFFLLFLHNMDNEFSRVHGEMLFQVYWEPDGDMARIRSQWTEMKKLPFLTQIETYTPEKGLQELSEGLGPDVKMDWLREKSPLPPTAMLAFSPKDQDPEAWSAKMKKDLESFPGVIKVHSNTVSHELAKTWGAASRKFVWPLIFFLALVFALVVGNTIKLSLLSRRDEVEILKLVGARDWYVQIPLVINGIAQSLAGGVSALLLLKLLHAGLADVLNFPPLYIQLRFLPTGQMFGLLGVLTLVAVLSCLAASQTKDA